MPFEFKVRRRVEFSDTDMAGIMHYSNFFRFMETAEHAFFRSLGYSIVTTTTRPNVGWPRVHASCDFKSPLKFEDEVEIHLFVAEKRSKALTFLFKFNKETSEGTLEVARGKLTVVCVTKDSEGQMRATNIPPEIAALIETAPDSLL